MATAADDCCVKLWDLRKLKNFKTLPLDEGYEVRDLSFDSSGSYLAVAGSDVRVYLCKQWTELKVSVATVVLVVNFLNLSWTSWTSEQLLYLFVRQVLSDHTAMATGVRFGQNSQFMASTSMDRTLKIYGPQ